MRNASAGAIDVPPVLTDIKYRTPAWFLLVLALGLAWPSMASAAVTFPDGCSDQFGNATTATCNMTVAAAAGLMWWIVINDTDTITGLTDSGGNTHTATACNVNPTGNMKYCYGVTCTFTTSGALTFTATASGTTFGFFTVIETAGQATSSCQHGTPPAANVQTGTTAPTTGTHTVTTNGVGLAAFIALTNGSDPVLTDTDANFVYFVTYTVDDIKGAGAVYEQATAANVAAGANSSTSQNFMSFVFAMSPPGSSGCAGRLTLLGAGC